MRPETMPRTCATILLSDLMGPLEAVPGWLLCHPARMDAPLAATVVSAVATILLGLLGWFGAHFVGVQILEFRRIRQEIHEALFFTANVPYREGVEQQAAVADAAALLRRLAARLDALRVSLAPIPAWWLSRRYDLREATAGLTGLSNCIGEKDGYAAVFRDQIERALDLPLSYSAEGMAALKRRLFQPTGGK